MKDIQRQLDVERSVIRLIGFGFGTVVLPIGLFFGARLLYLYIRYGSRDAKTVLFTVFLALVLFTAATVWIVLARRLPPEVRAYRDAKRDPLRKIRS